MSFLVLISLLALLHHLAWRLAGRHAPHRDSMRVGIAAGFLFTGVDHFASAATRYVPMVPDLLQPVALELVWASGAAEIAGALALLAPARLLHAAGLPRLRRQAGIALALLLAVLVVANVNVALKGQGVHGLDFGAWYFWLRPAFQPLLVWWVLYAVGVVGAPGRARGPRPQPAAPPAR